MLINSEKGEFNQVPLFKESNEKKILQIMQREAFGILIYTYG